MTYRLLIDECLSPELVEMALAAGHVESTCLRDRGRLGKADHAVTALAVENDFTLVTCNSYDFRGRGASAPGGHYGRQEVHPGLICLNSVRSLDIDNQRDLFQIALDELARRDDLINTALDVFEYEDGSVYVEFYAIPRPADEPPERPPAVSRGLG